MKRCPSCGKDNISDTDRYCPDCGKRDLVDSQSGAAIAPSQAPVKAKSSRGFLTLDVNERVTTGKSKEEVLRALELRFQKISRVVQRQGDSVVVKSIAGSFGGKLRTDTTTITANPVEGGYLLVAETKYRPSITFWVALVILLFTAFLWIGLLVLFSLQKGYIRRDIEEGLKYVSTELHGVAAPVSAHPSYPAIPAQAPTPVDNRKLYVQLGSEVKGPYTGDQLKALLDTGAVHAETPACVEGATAWQTISALL